MQQNFDSVKFIQNIGSRLVDEISNARDSNDTWDCRGGSGTVCKRST